jgi:release factor glutamine methyltransferase
VSDALPATPLTISQALHHARQLGVERLDAQLLLCAAINQPRSWLIAHDQDALDADQARRFVDHTARRARGEPLAYILGDKGFFGLNLAVSPSVLIPRPDTETLVEWALELIPDTGQACRVLDLGTGSGAIALALQHARPQAQLTAVDASAPALAVAQTHAEQLKLPMRFLHGSWLSPVAGERFELIVSNPPYIAEGDPHLAALQHEPISALTAGPDGLSDLRQIIALAPNHLTRGGWLLLEHGYDQAEAVGQLLTQAGFTNIATRIDLGGNPRCTGGQHPI